MFERPDQWVDPFLVSDAKVDVRGSATFEIRRYCDDLAHVLPSHNTAIIQAMTKCVALGDVAIDAGANIGALTVPLARLVGRNGRVLAIEMMPDTARQLERNLALNGLRNVKVIQAALSDRDDQTVSAFVPQGGFHGQASISRAPDGPGETVEVQTATLDRLLRDYTEIAFVKMDLEGAEAAALRGCRDSLQRIKAVLFESWARDGGEVRAMLERVGFVIHPVDSRNYLAIRAADEPG